MRVADAAPAWAPSPRSSHIPSRFVPGASGFPGAIDADAMRS